MPRKSQKSKVKFNDMYSIKSKLPLNTRPKSLIEQAKNAEAALAYRNNFLEAQNRTNYKNELDRIHGILSATTLHPIRKQDLINRREQLRKLINDSLKMGM